MAHFLRRQLSLAEGEASFLRSLRNENIDEGERPSISFYGKKRNPWSDSKTLAPNEYLSLSKLLRLHFKIKNKIRKDPDKFNNVQTTEVHVLKRIFLSLEPISSLELEAIFFMLTKLNSTKPGLKHFASLKKPGVRKLHESYLDFYFEQGAARTSESIRKSGLQGSGLESVHDRLSTQQCGIYNRRLDYTGKGVGFEQLRKGIGHKHIGQRAPTLLRPVDRKTCTFQPKVGQRPRDSRRAIRQIMKEVDEALEEHGERSIRN
tara:strand:- start:247 stop:1032 length:786 start_codon:yes stop_codon:yes gene_type:complete